MLSKNNAYGSDVWKHEYGHRLQFKEWGGFSYMEFMVSSAIERIFVPQITIKGIDYTNPNEYDADARASHYFNTNICEYHGPYHPILACRF